MARLWEMSSAELARAATKRRINSEYLANADRELAKRLDRINRQFPHINAATAMALAEQGFDSDSVEVKTVGELQARRDSDESAWDRIKGHFTDSVEGTAKPFVRTSLTALNAPFEFGQGQFRTGLEGARSGDWRATAAPFGLAGLASSGKVGEIAGQTRIGAAVEVSRNSGGRLSVPDALNNLPQVGPDGDPANLLDRNQQTWFSGPNSLAEKRQVANARNAGMVNGRATTFGRAATWVVGFQPGGVAHDMMDGALRLSNNPMWDTQEARDDAIGTAEKIVSGSVDFAAALSPLDPVGALSKGRNAQVAAAGNFGGRTIPLEKPGVVLARVKDKATGEVRDVPILVPDAPRKTVVFQNAHDWLTKTNKGARFIDYAAKETNYERLAAVLGRNVPPQTVLRILDEKDPAVMRDVILEEMGRGFITRKPTLGVRDVAAVGGDQSRIAGIGAAVMRRPQGRWAQLAPSEVQVSRSDPAWAVEQYRRMAHAMRTGRAKENLTPDFISANVEAFARGLTDPDADWSVPYVALADMAKQSLTAHGVQRGHAEDITRIWMERVTSQRNYWVDRHSGAAKNAFVTVDGVDLPLPKAAASAEMFTDSIPLLNTREFAKAASRLSKLYQNPGWEGLVSVGDAGTAFFKFMVLPVRGVAWSIRNLAEASARLVVEGVDGLMGNPLVALAYRVGDNPDSAASRALGRADRAEGRAATNSAGDVFRLQAELEEGASRFARTQEHKGGPWNDEHVLFTGQFPVVRREGNNYRQWLTGQRFTYGKLSASPEYRMAVDAESPLHAKNMFWKSPLRQKMAQQEPQLATRQGADAFMDKVYERIQDVTNGNPHLRQAIATGKIDGHPLVTRDQNGNLAVNPKAEAALEKYADDLPEFTVTPESVRGAQRPDSFVEGAEFLSRSVFQGMFAAFGSIPNNRFVNSPAFRQLHWQDAERLAPLATAQARKQLVANARKARMPKDVIRRLENVQGPTGTLDVTDIADLADARAFERWMDIVYNSHNKGNWVTGVRMISPFAAAVADMYRFWGKRLARNPLILHRVEQGMHGARQSGFFYTDENGEERFAYPLTRGLSQMMTGIDKGLSGTVKGANMITSSILPGAGPVVSWPVGLLPDRPELDPLREIINPYGDPDAEGGMLEGFAPRHVQRIMAALGHGSGEQKRAYQEALADTMAYLASTGDYGSSVKEQERLRKDAQAKGRMLYLVQAFAQAGLPSSPRGEFQFEDPTGRVHALAKVAGDYRKMLRDDPDTASVRLWEKYGDAVFLAVSGSTEGTGQLVTEDAHDLARENPEVTERYGLVWSFFTDPGSPYSHDEFRRQIKADERKPRSLQERQVAAQSMLANSVYMQHKREFGPFPDGDEKAYLRTVKAELKKEFPLWDDSFNAGRVQKRVEQAFAAAKDPAFAGTDVAKAVLAYQEARREVIDAANSAGFTDSETGWGRAKKTETHRDYLRFVAASLIEQTPEFGTLWERVFDAEMVDDVEGAVE